MSKRPWVTIVGLGEDGPAGLCAASVDAIAAAEIVIGPARHLALLGATDAKQVTWPIPFADGIEVLRGYAGLPVVVLASGDPFWFGAGRAISNAFSRDEWRSLPAPSTFSLAASRMGWSIEDTLCIGLHAAPIERLRPYVSPGLQAIVLLRDGAAVAVLAEYLLAQGFDDSTLTVCEALGGPRERISTMTIRQALAGSFTHPVCVAIDVAGAGTVVPLVSGRPDDLFETDGVMTKRPMRALTLSALAPRPGEHLWDIGGGSGTITVEWALSGATCTATVVEARADRIALIRANAQAFGVETRVTVVQGEALDALDDVPEPDAVFIGGGLSDAMLARVISLPKGTRIVANAVTLEAEALLAAAHAAHGGGLMRIEIAHAKPLGPKRGWSQAYPVVQWSVTL